VKHAWNGLGLVIQIMKEICATVRIVAGMNVRIALRSTHIPMMISSSVQPKVVVVVVFNQK